MQSLSYYLEQVQKQIINGVTPEKVMVDLRMIAPKPLHAKWFSQFYDHKQANKEIILNGWKRFGISTQV